MFLKEEKRGNKLKLYGFNNLTKALSFNIYDVCYAKTEREQRDYIAYIDEQYNSERLTKILLQVTDMIGATVLNIANRIMSLKVRALLYLLLRSLWFVLLTVRLLLPI